MQRVSFGASKDIRSGSTPPMSGREAMLLDGSWVITVRRRLNSTHALVISLPKQLLGALTEQRVAATAAVPRFARAA